MRSDAVPAQDENGSMVGPLYLLNLWQQKLRAVFGCKSLRFGEERGLGILVERWRWRAYLGVISGVVRTDLPVSHICGSS
jgi:hypothetical protein